MDVLAQCCIAGDPGINTHMHKSSVHQYLYWSCAILLACVWHPVCVCVYVCLSPGVSECLVTGETLGWIFFHQTADEILGWEKKKGHQKGHKRSIALDTQTPCPPDTAMNVICLWKSLHLWGCNYCKGQHANILKRQCWYNGIMSRYNVYDPHHLSLTC